MCVEDFPPVVDRTGLRIVQPGGVLSMPVRAVLQRHVIADEDDLSRAELAGEVERVKPAVTSPADFARVVEDQGVGLLGLDLVDVGIGVRRAAVLRELQSLERRASFMRTPPTAVAGVEGFGPSCDLVCVVDCEDRDFRFPRGEEVDFCDAGSAGDDDADPA